jgi:hypothetical protein
VNAIAAALPGNFEITGITAGRRRAAVEWNEDINPESVIF